MKLFVNNVIGILLVYLIISYVVSYFTPYHWGNPWYSSKIQHLEKQDSIKFNTFFFGSSRVYRQINPYIFDSTVNSISNSKIVSFNLGASATFNPQCYFLYEKFLNSSLSKNAKYCFIELMEVDLINDFFLHQERTTYWQNYSDILYVGNSIYFDEKLSLRNKLKSSLNYSVSYIESVFHLGHFGSQINNSNFYDERFVGRGQDGFLSLDFDYETTDDEVVVEHLFERRQRILENPKLIESRKNTVAKAYHKVSNLFDSANLDRMLQLIEKSEQRGVQLIFILSPRNGTQQLVNLSNQIPARNLIDMAEPTKYEQFYSLKNSFDLGHLNNRGAKLYSEKLGQEFRSKMN